MKSSYTPDEIQYIYNYLESENTFHFPVRENGLFPAVLTETETEYTGYDSMWVRDNIHIAHAHHILGKDNVAVKNVQTLADYFNKHRYRFENIIENKVDPQEPMNRPHVRFDGRKLEEINHKWSHVQNDALGYFLWFYSKLANQGLINVQPQDIELLVLFVFYFEAINYWADEDSGHWEEARKVEASSIGVVVAALQETRQLFKKTPSDSAFRYKNKILTDTVLYDLIKRGRDALDAILPMECIQDDPAKRREYDAALLFLVYPLKVVEGEVADQIVERVINNLQGPFGIRRYLGDSYWSPDYKKNLSPERRTIDFSDDITSRDKLLTKQGLEAQWCLFDPIVSCIFGLKYQETNLDNYLWQQTQYLNRSLGQITATTPRCPEMYYIEDSTIVPSKYIPNDSTPLLWTQANLCVALTMMKESLLRK